MRVILPYVEANVQARFFSLNIGYAQAHLIACLLNVINFHRHIRRNLAFLLIRLR